MARYTSDEIAHAWVSQQSTIGKCPSSMSFDGDEFYSYSTVVARVLRHNERKAYVLTDQHYSVTTSRHMGEVRHAVRNQKVFYVPEVCDSAERILRVWQRGIESKVESVLNHGEFSYLSRAEAMAAQQAEFAAYFGIDLKAYAVTVPTVDSILTTWKRDANKILARILKSDPEFKTGITIEAFKVVRKMRTLARGAKIPIEKYRVILPLKEPAILAAIASERLAEPIRRRLAQSAPTPNVGIFDVLDSITASATGAA